MFKLLLTYSLGLSHLIAAADDSVSVPWSGRFQKLTIATINETYMTHILTMRKDGTSDLNKYLKLDSNGRTPGYNADTGTCAISVDNDAIFKEQTTFRRTELVQKVKVSSTFFFRFSFRMDFVVNAIDWQVAFDESHVMEVRLNTKDSTDIKVSFIMDSDITNPVKVYKYTLKTWVNGGFYVDTTAGTIDYYYSVGTKPLEKITGIKSKKPNIKNGDISEIHIGMLTLEENGQPLNISSTKMETIIFNGVSVEEKLNIDGSGTLSASPPSVSEELTPPLAQTPVDQFGSDSSPPATIMPPPVTPTEPTTIPSSDQNMPPQVEQYTPSPTMSRCTKRIR